MKMVDREYFYSNVQAIRPLRQPQVDGINEILEFYDRNDYDLSLGGLGSYLGQCKTESAGTFKPIREMGSRNYFRYLVGKLGIRTMEEAWLFRGWGRIQTTGIANFARAVEIINKTVSAFEPPLFKDAYDLAQWLDREHSKRFESEYDLIVSFECVSKGLYTGKRMNDFIRPDGTFDFFNARKVINPGEIKRNFNRVRDIALESEVFFNALRFKET